MRYKNTKTGAIIDSPCTISGGDWIEVIEDVDPVIPVIPEDPEDPEDVEDVEDVEGTEDAEKDGLDGITVKEIKQELDAFGIKYNPRAKKQELYDLMIKGR